jgi:hypothetical protein
MQRAPAHACADNSGKTAKTRLFESTLSAAGGKAAESAREWQDDEKEIAGKARASDVSAEVSAARRPRRRRVR